MNPKSICVVGMGYVGLPLAVALSNHYKVTGFDVSNRRITSLKKGVDTNMIISSESLSKSDIDFTEKADCLQRADMIIVTVPTPVNLDSSPDVKYLKDVSETIGKQLALVDRSILKYPIILFESTTYPGCTEEVCKPIIEKYSHLKCGEGFRLGYSPERTNFGDSEHDLSSVVKVVSGQDDQTTEDIASVYSTVVGAGVYMAPNIKTAEAAKLIENVQRDLNIALVNELAIVFDHLDLDSTEVFKAAATKWNFVPFKPGLVGGHCIPVDPYYLTHVSKESGYLPKIILAGREINDQMYQFIGKKINKLCQTMFKNPSEPIEVLVLGFSFKKNISDTRNSQVPNLVRQLTDYGYNVSVNDPVVGSDYFRNSEFTYYEGNEKLYDVVIFSVDHDAYVKMGYKAHFKHLKKFGLFIDINATFHRYKKRFNDFSYWSP